MPLYTDMIMDNFEDYAEYAGRCFYGTMGCEASGNRR